MERLSSLAFESFLYFVTCNLIWILISLFSQQHLYFWNLIIQVKIIVKDWFRFWFEKYFNLFNLLKLLTIRLVLYRVKTSWKLINLKNKPKRKIPFLSQMIVYCVAFVNATEKTTFDLFTQEFFCSNMRVTYCRFFTLYRFQ